MLICRPKGDELYPTEAIVLNLDDFSYGHQAMISTGTPHAMEGLIDPAAERVEPNWDDRTTLWSNDPTTWSQSDFSRIEDGVLLTDHAALVLQQIGTGVNQGGLPLAAKAERIGISLGEPSRRKFVRRVWPRFQGAIDGLITISIGVSEFASQAPTYGTPQPFVIGTDRFVNVNASGNYLAYKIESVGGLTWTLPALDLDVELQGRF